MFSRQPVSRRDDLGRVIDQFVARGMVAVAPEAREWWRDDVLAAGVRREVEAAVAKCFDAEVAAAFRAKCPVAGTNDQDYLSRMLAAPDGRWALVSMRFRGMRVDEPFVELDAASFALGLRDLEQLIASIKVVFRRMGPRYLRVYVGTHQADDAMLDELDWRPDLVFVAAPIAGLQARPRPARYEELALRPWDGDYARYAAVHESVDVDLDVPFPPAELEALARDGVLFDAYRGDSWVGMVGAADDTLFGAPATVVCEEVLAPACRGQGLGPALQRHLIERLPAGGVLHGTIDRRNQPSLRTALACGRRELGMYRLYSL